MSAGLALPRFGGERVDRDGQLGATTGEAVVLDLGQRLAHVEIVGESLEKGLILHDGGAELAELDVGLGDALGGVHHVLLQPQLHVGFLEDFQRLVVERLRLSDHAEHLNRLLQLRFFAGSQGGH